MDAVSALGGIVCNDFNAIKNNPTFSNQPLSYFGLAPIYYETEYTPTLKKNWTTLLGTIGGFWSPITGLMGFFFLVIKPRMDKHDERMRVGQVGGS